MRAIDYGKKVVLIEKLGGAGLYDGVLSSKTMWEYSQTVLNAKHINSGNLKLDVQWKDMKKPYRRPFLSALFNFLVI